MEPRDQVNTGNALQITDCSAITPNHINPKHIAPNHITPNLINPKHIYPNHITPNHITVITPNHRNPLPLDSIGKKK